MRKILSILSILISLLPLSIAAKVNSNTSAYFFSFKDLNGKSVKLSHYEDKVILVVNTASQCGYTPQYARLQSLYESYRAKGLEIIGVPSPDFGNQEFDDKIKIKAFTHEKYGVKFPLMAPQHVIGGNAHPFYTWANSQVGPIGSPKWNFHKYLLNKHGQLIAWFPSSVSPDDSRIKRAIEKSLKDK